ncbi:hypothetical protein WJX74_005484 [Apatococcus lobatus]|uniref:Uncharacterized protein n=1 Tax=Apatococcus lobatus TaxID=904363 RepID=A0AAW1QAD9_9CHLO
MDTLTGPLDSLRQSLTSKSSSYVWAFPSANNQAGGHPDPQATSQQQQQQLIPWPQMPQQDMQLPGACSVCRSSS